jgi:2-iminobutanoate/2-iminopropanoate deaminase
VRPWRRKISFRRLRALHVGYAARRSTSRSVARRLVRERAVHDATKRSDVMAKIEKYTAEGVFDPPTYSQAIKVTEAQTILFLAGQVAYDKDGSPAHRGDFKAQAREAFKALKALVEVQGGTLDNIVKINTYMTDIRYRADLVPVREEFFGKKAPASTLVEVSALAHPDWLIEIEAIAVL